MKMKLFIILSVVVLLMCWHYAAASTVYDEYKATIADAEKMLSKYEKEKADLQEYLDVVASGDQEAWEAARKKSAVLHALLMHKDMDEVEAVKSQLTTTESMIRYEQGKINVSRHKMDLYFNAYIKQDMEAINQILSNGNRTVPEDITGNIYLAWPYTELPENLLTDKKILFQNVGNVYLAPVTVLENAYSTVWFVDIYGVKAEVSFKEIPVREGETINLYFVPAGMETETMSFLLAGPPESTIDMYYNMQKKEEE